MEAADVAQRLVLVQADLQPGRVRLSCEVWASAASVTA